MRMKAGGSSIRRLGKRIAFGTVFVLVGYTLCGYFLVPRLIRNQIVSRARTLLQREARMDEVRFNPFTLTTTIKGFVLADRDGADLLKVERFLADLQLSGLFRRAARFREVRIDRTLLNARILQDGRPSVAELIETDTKDSGESFQLPRLLIDRLILSGGDIGFSDASRQPAYESRFEPLNLDISNLITFPAEGGDHTLTVGVDNGAVLRWTGRQTIEPLRFSGQLDIKGLSLSRLSYYFGQSQPPDLA